MSSSLNKCELRTALDNMKWDLVKKIGKLLIAQAAIVVAMVAIVLKGILP